MNGDLVIVERREGDVVCPKFGEKAIKQNYPSRPMPAVPKNAENVTGALGQVYCASCDQTYFWGYRGDS